MSAYDKLGPFFRKRSAILLPFFLAVLLVLPFLGVLFHPTAGILGHPSGDAPASFYFFHDYAARCWLSGQVPLWNPHIMMGTPFLAGGEASVFHPLSAFFLFLPTGLAMNVTIITAFVLGGLAFYDYLRSLQLCRIASALGSIVWSFSSVPIARVYAGHLSILWALPAWPFVLACWHRYLCDRRLRPLVLLALAYATLILTGHFQSTYIFSIFFLAYVILHGLGREPRYRYCAIGLLAVFIVLGVAIGAVQLLPSLDFARNSFRSQSSYELCTFFSLPPEGLITLICPEFFGRHPGAGAGQFWGRQFFWEVWVYVGILPLFAAVTGLFTAPRRQRLALALPAIFFFLLGLGRNTPLYRLFYDFVPLYDVFRCPSRHCMVTVFCLAALAGHGFQSWIEASSDAREESQRASAATATLVLGISLLAICIVSLLLLSGSRGDDTVWRRFMDWVWRQKEIHLPPIDGAFCELAARFASRQLWRAAILLLLSIALLVGRRRWGTRSGTSVARWRSRVLVIVISLILLGDFATFIPHFTDRFDEARTKYSEAFLSALPRTPYPVRYYDDRTYPNAAMHYGFSSIGGYVSNTLGRYNRFLNETQGMDPSFVQASVTIRGIPPLYFDLLAIDALHLPRSVAPKGLPSTPIDADWLLVDCRGRCPRAFVAESPRPCPNPDDALHYILSKRVDVQASPVIETLDLLPESAPLDTSEHVEFASFQANRIELTVETTRPRIVVLNEMFYKDWTAQVNGQTATILPANYLFRSVAVPSGRSTIVFEFSPWSFSVGKIVSMMAVMCAAVILVFANRITTARAREGLRNRAA
jgi:hypothetical protein